MKARIVGASLLAITIAVSAAILGRYYVHGAHTEWLYLRADPHFNGLWDFGHHITLVPAYVITLFALKRVCEEVWQRTRRAHGNSRRDLWLNHDQLPHTQTPA